MVIIVEGYEIQGPNGLSLFRTRDVVIASLWASYDCSIFSALIQVRDTNEPQYHNKAGGCDAL